MKDRVNMNSLWRGVAFTVAMLAVSTTMVYAQATQVRVETAANGGGAIVPAQSLASGQSIVVYAVTRTVAGVFVVNDSATWSLDTLAGGVVAGDLVPHPNGKSATFTARVTGSANIRATIVGLTSVLSGKLTVVAGPASRLFVFTEPSATATAGVNFVTQPVVRILDASGNHVTTDNTTQVTATRLVGIDTLRGTLTKTVVGGVATFTDLRHNIAGTINIRFTSAPVLTPDTSSNILVNPAAASKLTLQTQPSPTATAGVVFAQQPVVRIEDSFGNLVTSNNSTVVTATRTAGTGTLQGTTALVASGGLISFTNLKHNVAGTITINFTSAPVLTPVLSNSVLVNPAAASKLIFLQQPTNAVSGASIAPAVTVQLQDTFSNNVTQSGISVLMSLSSGTGTLGGTATQSTVAGVATFSNLSVNLVGTKALTASSTGLTSAVSNTFSISAGVPASIVASAGTPQNTVVNTAFASQLQATVRDAAGNLVGGASVTFTAPTTGARGTFVGGLSSIVVVTDTLGVARATAFTANTIAGAYNVSATVTGVGLPALFAMTNNPGPARRITATAGTPQSTQIATQFAVAFQATVQDTFGNVRSGDVVRWTRPTTGASGTFVGGVDSAITNASGIATAPAFFANIIAGSYTVTATTSGAITPASYALTNNPGPASSVTATAGTSQSTQVGTAFATNLQASVKDAANNPIVNALVTFTRPPQSGASGTFAGGIDTVRTNAGGLATAPVLTANLIAGSYTVSARVSGVSDSATYALTNLAGPAGSITPTAGTPQTTTVNTNFATSLQAIVRDASGNPVNNVTVTFTAPSSGASGKFGGVRTATAQTNASGIATAPTFTADTIAGSYTVSASAPSVGTPASFALTNSAGPVARLTAIAGTPQSTQVGTPFGTNMKARVTDSFNNPLRTIVVTFTPPTTGASGAFQGGVNTATTDSTGTATAVQFTANSTAGSYFVRATAGAAARDSFALTNSASAAASITATAGTSQSTTVGTLFPTILQAIVRDASSNPVSGVPVTFTSPLTGASATFNNDSTTYTINTNASGIATATARANNTAGGPYTVNARVSGVSTPATYSLTNTPGVAASVVTVSGTTPQTATVNTAFSPNLAVIVRDAVGNPVSGVLVTFTKPATGPSGTFAGGVETATTNASGIATAVTFTANTIAGGPYLVRATVSGVATPADFSLTNRAGAAATVTISAGNNQAAPVNTAFATNLAVLVRDAFTNPVGGATVTFSAPAQTGPSGTFAGGVNVATTTAAGIATATVFTANGRSGQYSVTASTGGASSATFTLTNTAGGAASIVPTQGTPQVAQVGTAFPVVFKVLVRDASGNAVPNVTVTFTPPASGAGGTFAGSNAVLTDTTGVATAPAFTANTTSGAYRVNAIVGGVGTPAPFELRNNPGPATSVTVVSGASQQTTVGAAFPLPLQVVVRDGFSNPVGSVTVTYTSPSGTGVPTCSFSGAGVGTAATDTNGIAKITAVANNIAGSYNVAATVSGVTGAANFPLTNLAGAPASIAATGGTPQTAQVNTAFATNLQATLKDAFDNLVPNALVRFVPPASGPSGAFQGAIDTVRTNTNGVATARIFIANGTSGSYAVTASAVGFSGAGTATFSLTNQAGAPGSVTKEAGDNQSTQVATAFATRLRVRIRDGSGNVVPGIQVVFGPVPTSGPSGSFQGSTSVTTDTGGVAISPVLIANTIAGNWTVNVSAQGASSPAIFQLTNLPGPARRLRATAGTPQSARVSTGFATPFEASVQDTFGNAVSNITVRWTAPTSEPTGTFPGGLSTATANSATNGIATAPGFTASIRSGSYVLRATSTGLADTASYLLTNTSSTVATIGALQGTPQSTVVNTVFPSNLRVVVRDVLGNGVARVLVQFSRPLTGPSATFLSSVDTVRTDSNGVASTSSLRANTRAGSYVVRATVSGISDVVDFELTNRTTKPAAIFASDGTPQTTQVNTNFPTRFRVTVRDSFGNPILGSRVTFVAPATGASGFFVLGINHFATGDSGVAIADVFRANGIAGAYIVRATADSLTASANFNLSNSTGVAGIVSTNTGSTPQSANVNSLFANPLAVTVTDSSSNPVGGVNVRFIAPSSGPSGRFAGGGTDTIVTTGSDGIAAASRFTANAVAGSYSVVATLTDGAAQATFNLTNSVGGLNGFVIEAQAGGAIPTQLTMNAFNVRIRAIDAFNNTVQSFDSSVVISSTSSLLVGGGQTAAFSGGQLIHRVIVRRSGLDTLTATRGTKFGRSNGFQVINPAPRFATAAPNVANLGDTVTMTISGSNFIDSTVTSLNMGTNITVNSISVIDTTQMFARITISAIADTGFRNITLINATPGGGTSLPVLFRVSIPFAAPPVLAGPANASINLSLPITLAWSSVSLSSYRLQIATDSTFTERVFDSVLTQISRTFGEPTLTLGKKYYWRVASINPRGQGSFSLAKWFSTRPFYPSSYTLNTSIAFPSRATQGDYPATDYRIVGLPGNGRRVSDQTSIRVDQVLTGTFNVDWIVYNDNGAAQNFFDVYDGSPSFNFLTGRAFWILRKGNLNISNIIVQPEPIDTTAYVVRVPLHSGWNLITNPYTISIPWNRVRLKSGNVVERIFRYNGSFQESATFDSYIGYCFFSSTRDTLEVPFGSFGSALEKIPTSAKTRNAEWVINAELTSGELVDRTTSFGVVNGARAGRDSLEFHKPRAFGEIPAVYFERPEWDQTHSAFAADYRPVFDQIETWAFNVRAKLRADVTLRFDGINQVPEQFKVFLVDEQRARAIDLRSTASYQFSLPTGNAAMKVVIGTSDAVQHVLDGVLPKEFALGNNFPNPFNPTTTIPIAVPHSADITVKVYNILGEEVRTIFAGTLDAGRYFLAWDGKNNYGNTVASGTYITRFTTNSGRAFTGKMVLMK